MKKTVLYISVCIVVFVISTSAILSSAGKQGYSGSPGEGNCTSCHNDFVINSDSGSIQILTNIPTTGYELNTTYEISVKIAQKGKLLFGFDLEALSGTTTYANAGTFIITNSTQSQIKTKQVSGVSRNNVVHVTDGGFVNDSMTFTFNWTSPTTNVGDVTFYTSGVAADADGGNAGDYVYSTSQIISYATTTSINENHSTLNTTYNYELNSIFVNYTTHDKGDILGNLYSINGKLIETIIKERLANNSIQKNYTISTPLTSGIYIFQIQQNGKTNSTKMLID